MRRHIFIHWKDVFEKLFLSFSFYWSEAFATKLFINTVYRKLVSALDIKNTSSCFPRNAFNFSAYVWLNPQFSETYNENNDERIVNKISSSEYNFQHLFSRFFCSVQRAEVARILPLMISSSPKSDPSFWTLRRFSFIFFACLLRLLISVFFGFAWRLYFFFNLVQFSCIHFDCSGSVSMKSTSSA